VCDHGSTQNKVRTIFCKNTFLNRKPDFFETHFFETHFFETQFWKR